MKAPSSYASVLKGACDRCTDGTQFSIGNVSWNVVCALMLCFVLDLRGINGKCTNGKLCGALSFQSKQSDNICQIGCAYNCPVSLHVQVGNLCACETPPECGVTAADQPLFTATLEQLGLSALCMGQIGIFFTLSPRGFKLATFWLLAQPFQH
jgi:hypothetical protein